MEAQSASQEEIQTGAAANEETEGAFPADVRIDIPSKSGGRLIHRAPLQLCGNKNPSIYDPVVLSVGPHHHGQPQLLPVEEFRGEFLSKFVTASTTKVCSCCCLSMEDYSPTQQDNNKTREVRVNVANNEIKGSAPADVTNETLSESRRLRIHRVPPHMRQKNPQIFDPVVLSLGPYHHGKPQLRQLEEFKEEALAEVTEGKAASRTLILPRIAEIRSHYEEVEYNDEELADIILCDAYFILYLMRSFERGSVSMLRRLGLSTFSLAWADIILLENQIPIWVIRLLLELNFGEQEGETLLCKFLSGINFGDQNRLQALPWKGEEREPLHLLEALRTIKVRPETAVRPKEPRCLTKIFSCKKRWRSSTNNSKSLSEKINLPFRSVTSLKTKGIYFEPSSYCFTDISFTSYSFYGILKLPILLVDEGSKMFFSNTIAFEMSPETVTNYAVMSYINFMKSLIEDPKDVKVLRERGILLSVLGSDEEVVRVFKEINTYGMHNWTMFESVKTRIEKHCNHKAKTWMAEFFHTNLRNPCTTVAFLAATFLLCLTFLQTYYTIRPAN